MYYKKIIYEYNLNVSSKNLSSWESHDFKVMEVGIYCEKDFPNVQKSLINFVNKNFNYLVFFKITPSSLTMKQVQSNLTRD